MIWNSFCYNVIAACILPHVWVETAQAKIECHKKEKKSLRISHDTLQNSDEWWSLTIAMWMGCETVNSHFFCFGVMLVCIITLLSLLYVYIKINLCIINFLWVLVENTQKKSPAWHNTCIMIIFICYIITERFFFINHFR